MRRNVATWRVALILELVVAAWLRVIGIDFGLPALNDPDELIFELGAIRMLHDHSLNPGWFGHPATTTIYGLAILNIGTYLVGHLVGWFADANHYAAAVYTNPAWMIIPGRALMLVLGVVCVGLTYRLGRLMRGPAVGIVGAALLAVNPVHITYSQIIRSDMTACVFMLLCLASAVRIARDGHRADYLKASVWLGLAVASKWPFAASGLGVLGAGLSYALAHPAARRGVVLNLMLFGIASVSALIIVSPYLVLDYQTVLQNLGGETQARHLEATGGSPLANIWWYVRYPLLAGFGLGGLALVVVGLILSTRNREVMAIFVPVMLGFLLLMAPQNLVWQRWALPLMPMLSIVAGIAFVWLAAFLRTRMGRMVAFGAGLAAAALVLVPLLGSAAADARERRNDTRQMASRWAIRSIPSGSTILLEHFAFDLVPQPWNFLFPLGVAGCIDARAVLRGRIPYTQVDKQRGGRSNLDIGTIPPDRRASCRADFAILTQYDRYRAARGTFAAEYDNYQRLIASGTLVATFRPEPGVSGGPIVRIIHFAHGQGTPVPAPAAPAAPSIAHHEESL